MATGDKRINLMDVRNLGTVDLKTWVVEVLSKGITDAVARNWRQGGFYESTAFVAGGARQFYLVASDAPSFNPRATDGDGHLLTWDSGSVVDFEGGFGSLFYVGLQYAEAFANPETNPRTGTAQYRSIEELVGVQGAPDSVAHTGGGVLKLVVDSITEANVSNAGRTVRVQLVSPASSIAAVAIQDLTVQWDGVNNYVETAGDYLGQSATSFSTTAVDYRVILIGPRVSHFTDLSAVDGVAYVGTVTGNGGAPPGAFDTTGQRLLLSLDALWDCFEYDAQGYLKVAVKVDAVAVGEAQISVVNGSVRVLWADEAGNLTLQGLAGNDSPKIQFRSDAAGGADVYTRNGALTFEVDTVSKAIVLTGPGVLYAELAPTQIDNRLEATKAALEFVDPNMPAPIPLSNGLGGSFTSELDADLPQTILGAINVTAQQERLLRHAVSPAGHTSSGTVYVGLDVDLDPSLELTINGEFKIGTDGDLSGAGTVTLPANGTTFVYLRASDLTLQSTSDPTTLADQDLLLSRYVTSGGAVTAQQSMILPLKRIGDRVDILVGPLTGGAHVETVAEAVTLAGPMIDSGFRDVRILVVGDTTETANPITVPDNLLVEGLPGATIRWSGDLPLFDLDGSEGAIFRDLLIAYAGTGTSAAGTRVVFRQASGASLRTTIENVFVFKSSTGYAHGFFLAVAPATGVRLLTIRGCRMSDSTSDYGIAITTAAANTYDVKIEDCEFDCAGALQGTNGTGIYVAEGSRIRVRSTRTKDTAKEGIDLASVSTAWITDCAVVNAGQNGVAINGTDIRIKGVEISTAAAAGFLLGSSTTRALISDCTVKSAGSEGIKINGEANRVRGCVFVTPGTTGATFEAGSTRCYLVDCELDTPGGSGITVDGTWHYIHDVIVKASVGAAISVANGANHLSCCHNRAILCYQSGGGHVFYTDGDYGEWLGNQIQLGTALSAAGIDGSYNQFRGNQWNTGGVAGDPVLNTYDAAYNRSDA